MNLWIVELKRKYFAECSRCSFPNNVRLCVHQSISQLKMPGALLKSPTCECLRALLQCSILLKLRRFGCYNTNIHEVLIVSDFAASLFLNIKMSTQCKWFLLALVLNAFVLLLCFLLSSVAVIQVGFGDWSVWYLTRPSSTVIGQLEWTLCFSQSSHWKQLKEIR